MKNGGLRYHEHKTFEYVIFVCEEEDRKALG